jgi:MFS family permease
VSVTTAVRRTVVDVRPLRESPAYRRLWIGQSLSAVGNMVTAVTLSLQVYAMTHSSLAVGLIGIMEAVPVLTVGLLGGAWADVLDRRSIVLCCAAAMAAVAAVLAVQATADLRWLWLVYLLAAVQAGLFAFTMPATRAMLYSLLPQERVPAAAALSLITFQASLVAGPLIAGALVGTAGPGAAYLADAASFGPLIYAAIKLPPMRVKAEPGTGIGAVLAGLRFVARQPVLSTVLALDFGSMVFGMPMALIPALAQHQFGGGTATAGLLYASPAIGGILAGTFSRPLSLVRRKGVVVLAATCVWGLAITGLGTTHILVLGVSALAIAGMADMVNGVFRTTMLQTNTPDELLGRVNAVGFVGAEIGPSLGNVEAGAVAAAVSPSFSAISGGLLCVVGAGLALVLRPALLRYRAAPAEGDTE